MEIMYFASLSRCKLNGHSVAKGFQFILARKAFTILSLLVCRYLRCILTVRSRWNTSSLCDKKSCLDRQLRVIGYVSSGCYWWKTCIFPCVYWAEKYRKEAHEIQKPWWMLIMWRMIRLLATYLDFDVHAQEDGACVENQPSNAASK